MVTRVCDPYTSFGRFTCDAVAVSRTEVLAIIPASLHTYSDFTGIRLTEEALFRGLSAAARKTLSEISHSNFIHPGELIFSEGDIPEELKILVEGHAILVIGNTISDTVGIRKAVEHEIFGIIESLGRSPFHYSLKAIAPCRIDSISKDDFEKFLNEEKLPRSRLMRILGIAVQMRHRFVRSL